MLEDAGAILKDKLRAKNCKVIIQSEFCYILKIHLFQIDEVVKINEERRKDHNLGEEEGRMFNLLLNDIQKRMLNGKKIFYS